MSVAKVDDNRKVTTHRLIEMKQRGEKISMLTAYDYSGGYQIGEYLYSCGYKKALFVAETEQDSDYYRWMGFKQAMEKQGGFCSRSR